MKFDFELASDQLSSTNHNLLPKVSSSASCQHILTMCIHSCTYMDTLPLNLYVNFDMVWYVNCFEFMYLSRKIVC